MKLSPEQLTALEAKFAFMRDMLTARGDVGLVWGANRNTPEGSVTLSLDELDALLSDVQELRSLLMNLVTGEIVDSWYCLYCNGYNGHTQDCRMIIAQKALGVLK